jgi:hypothetical protein
MVGAASRPAVHTMTMGRPCGIRWCRAGIFSSLDGNATARPQRLTVLNPVLDMEESGVLDDRAEFR